MEAAKASVRIVQNSRSPVMARSQGHVDITNGKQFPWLHFVYSVKPHPLSQRPAALRNNNRLCGRHSPQRPSIQMIEMSMRHQNEVDVGKMIQANPRVPDPLDHFQPKRPDGMDKNIQSPPSDREA